ENERSKVIAEKILLHVLENILKLLHPFMPFITEEIWRHLPKSKDTIIISSWPKYLEEMYNFEAEENMTSVMNGIRGIRNARQEMNIPPSKKARVTFVTENDDVVNMLNYGERYFINLASAEGIEILENKSALKGDNLSVVLDKCEAYIPLED